MLSSDSDVSPNDNLVNSNNIYFSSDLRNLENNKSPKRLAYTCRKCRVHHFYALSKGHICPFKNCFCKKVSFWDIFNKFF